jgi:hypothetical protein
MSRSPQQIMMAILSLRTDRSGSPRGPQPRRRPLPASWRWSSRVSTERRKAMPIPVCTHWKAGQAIRFIPRHREITPFPVPQDSQPRVPHTIWPPASVQWTARCLSRAGVRPFRMFLGHAQFAARGLVFYQRGVCQCLVRPFACSIQNRHLHLAVAEAEWLTRKVRRPSRFALAAQRALQEVCS